MFIQASEFTLEQQTDAFNRSFEKYVIPMRLTPREFADKVMFEAVDLTHSLIMLQDQSPIGIGLLAVKGTSGWIAGMGVIPELRGKGMGRALMEAMIERCRLLGLRELWLEVINRNDPALATYSRLGFEIQRELVIMKAERIIGAKPAPEVVELNPDGRWLRVFSLFHPVEPCWQRRVEVLNRKFAALSGTVFGICDEYGRTRAVVMFNVHDTSIELHDVGARAAEEEKLFLILGEVARRFPSRPLVLFNEPENSPFVPILRGYGFEETMRQYEMVLKIGSSSER